MLHCYLLKALDQDIFVVSFGLSEIWKRRSLE